MISRATNEQREERKVFNWQGVPKGKMEENNSEIAIYFEQQSFENCLYPFTPIMLKVTRLLLSYTVRQCK